MRTALKTKKRARPFVKAYIESNFNAAEAARKVLKTKDPLARQEGFRMLTKEYTQKTLAEVLDQQDGLDDEVIKSLLKRNAKQNKNLPASNTAIDMAIKVKGGYAPERKANFNLNMSESDLLARLQELDDEIKRISRGEGSNSKRASQEES